MYCLLLTQQGIDPISRTSDEKTSQHFPFVPVAASKTNATITTVALTTVALATFFYFYVSASDFVVTAPCFNFC